MDDGDIDRAGDDRPPRVLVVDDHVVVAEAFALVLRQEDMDVEVAPDVAGPAVLALAEEFRPDVVLLDLFMTASRTTVPLIRPLNALGARVLVVTGSDVAAELAECLDAGAVAVLPKVEALEASVDAIRRTAAGLSVRHAHSEDVRAAARTAKAERRAVLAPFRRLTGREREVLAALVDGRRAEEIAADLGVSVRTVRSHLEAIRSKLGVSSQLAAVGLARHARWTKDP